MAEVRVAPLLACRPRRNTSTPVFSSTRSSCVTLPLPLVIGFFSVPGLQVVQVEMAPVVALGEPDHFVRRRQVAPVDARRCPTRRRSRPSPRARRGSRRCGVGDAQLLAPVIARGRDERDASRCRGSTARRPSPPRHARSSQSVERCWSGGICSRTTSPVSTSMTTRWIIVTVVVAGQRILPRLQRRVADGACRRDTSRRRRADPAERSRSSSSRATRRRIGRSLRAQPALSVA